MPKRIETATDIATIGIWDPDHERHDLRGVRYKHYLEALQLEARAGHLFYIVTDGDGSFPVDILVEEPPAADVLPLYEQAEGEFLIISDSGRLIVGGLEDFVNDTKLLTTENDELQLTPGRYGLKLYQRKDDDFRTMLRGVIGVEDFDYYEKRSEVPWGCLLSVIGVVTLFLRLWSAALTVFMIWAFYMFIRWNMRAADVRYHEIANRVHDVEARFPAFIFAIRPIDDDAEIQGGWFEL